MTTESDRQFLQAAAQGDLGKVVEALAEGINVNTRGEYGDTALNEAAERGHSEVVKRLIEAGADIENVGGADKTPIMNAAFAGQVEVVQILLEKGARVSNDLLSTIQLKVNIFEENAEIGMVNPKAVEAWKAFLDLLITARLKQDLPEITAGLSAADAEERLEALNRVESAASRGIDISTAVPRLRELMTDPSVEARGAASASLSVHYARAGDWSSLRKMLESGDQDIQTGAMPTLVSAARDGNDVSPLLPAIVNLLGASELNLRHDAAITLGYAATHQIDVRDAVAPLTTLLSDKEPEARKMAAWALYRVAKHGGDASAAIPALRLLLTDTDEGVRGMAAEAVQMAEARKG